MKKLIGAIFILAALVMAPSVDAAGRQEIAIICTGSVNCSVEEGIGYAGVAALRADAQEQYGSANVTLIDAGDAIQGSLIGAVSEGEYIIELMNAVGYDLAVPGEHEFDYGLDRLRELAGMAGFAYLSCNFIDLSTGMTLLPPYEIINYGTVSVGYIGITTLDIFEGQGTSEFQNSNGSARYSFCQSEGGDELYTKVQQVVNTVRNSGADYVVAVGHLGADTEESWTAESVIANTCGIDVFVNGSSEEPGVTEVYNENGDSVLLTEVGTRLESVGIITIDVAANSIEAQNITEYDGEDQTVSSKLKEISREYNQMLSQTVAISQSALVAGNGQINRLVNSAETNLGDLCADAYAEITGADGAIVNGGSIGSGISAGYITYGDIADVFPYGEYVCMVEATGQQILDALELGAMEYPAQSDRFLQVSGIEYTVEASIPSAVVLSSDGSFEIVDGQRRVGNATIDGKPIDSEQVYTLALSDYILNGGYGFTMFSNCVVLNDAKMLDAQALLEYVSEALRGDLSRYSNTSGDGRITVSGISSAGVSSESEERVYIVTSGDNLWSIAKRELGSGERWAELYELNSEAIKRPELIYPGMELELPQE